MALPTTHEKQVITRFLDSYNELKKRKVISKKAEFNKALDMSAAYFSFFENQQRPVPVKYIDKLCEKFHISKEWIMQGIGPMFTMQAVKNNFQSNSKRSILPLAELTFSDLPYVPVPARATFADMASDPASYGQMTTYRVYNPPKEIEGKKAYVIEIDGDSMEPQLKSGDKVLAVEVDKGDWQYQVGRIYAIAFGSSFVVKRITNNDLMMNNRITLTSDNPAGGEITIKGNELVGMWRVLKGIDTAIV